METAGALYFSEEPSGYPIGDPEEILSSEGSEDAETSPPCGASLWLGVEAFLGLTALLSLNLITYIICRLRIFLHSDSSSNPPRIL